MVAMANILPVLFLLLLSYPFYTQARNTHLFNGFTQPKGDDQPQFEEAHATEKEKPVKAHIFQERKLQSDSENPSTSQVHGGSSSHDPTTTYYTPDGRLVRTTESDSSQWSDVTTPNGHSSYSHQESSNKVTITSNPSGFVSNSGNSVPSYTSSVSGQNTNPGQYSYQQYYSSTTP